MAGIIKYGSGDSNIVLECSLKAESAVTAAGGTLLGTGTFSVSRGFLSGTNGIRFDDVTNYASLTEQGQFSIDVERDWLAVANGISGQSSGYQPGDNSTTDRNEYLITHAAGNATNSTPFGRMRLSPPGDFIPQFDTGDSGASVRLSTLSGGDIVTLTVSWAGSVVDYYINGGHFARKTRASIGADCMRYFYVCSERGTASTGLQSHYVKNLVISDVPAVLANNFRVGVFGDSFVDQGKPVDDDTTTSDPGLDGRFYTSFGAHFSAQNRKPGLYFIGEGSHFISQSATPTLDDHVADMNNQSCRFVVIRAGTNDAATASFPSDFETSIKSYCTTFLANNATEKVIVCTVPSVYSNSAYDAHGEANVDAANTIINALPAWNSNVVIVDLFTLTGGHSPVNDYFVGLVTGARDDLHFSPKGQALFGKKVAEAVEAQLY